MGAEPKRRVVLLTEIISPYRVPVFNELAAHPSIDLKVLFFAKTEHERLWRVPTEKIRFAYKVLSGVAIPLPDRFPVFFNPGLWAALKNEAPEVLIAGGYHHPSCLVALCFAKMTRIPFILWSESHAQSTRLRGPAFDWYRRCFIRGSRGFIVPGRKSAEFLRGLGADSGRIWTAPNAVDNAVFSRAGHKTAGQSRWRGRFSKNVILFVGRLVKSKGLRTLLEATAHLSKTDEVNLIIVGEGNARRDCELFCERRGLSKNVFFEGFKQQEDLPFYYSMADVFVMPTLRETWGLVLNEACAAGLPVIATEKAGAAWDLIEDGINGFRVPAGDVQILRERLKTLLSHPECWENMGKASKRIAQQFTPQRCADGFIEAIYGVLKGQAAV